jgi:hypothetical protein
METFCERFTSQEITIGQHDEVRLEFGGDFAGAAQGRMTPTLDVEAEEEDDQIETSEDEVRDAWRSPRTEHDWIQRGWMERLVAGLLTERQRQLVSFLTGDNTNWTTPWRWIFGFLMLIALLMGVGIVPFAAKSGALFFMPFFYGMMFQFLLDDYPGFRMTDCSGTRVAQQAYYPLSTDELSKVFLKVACIKALVMSLLLTFVLLIVNVGIPLDVTAEDMFLIAVGVFSGYMLIYLWRLSVHLSGGLSFPRLRITNFWRPLITIALFAGTLASFGLFIGLSAAKSPLLIAALLVSWGCAQLNLWLVKRMVDQNVIDLVGSKLSWLDQSMNANLWKNQRWQSQMRKHERLRKKYGTFWWLRRPFG